MLLTNWLANVTSRLRKRPVFRSRDRRAIRHRWQTALSNQISTAEVLEDRTLLTTFFVDDDFTSGSDFSGTDTDPGTGGDQNAVWNVTAFATIQDAVNAAAASGDTIQVAAGTYSGLISLNKSVDLLGANAGIDPNTMARGAESIIDHDGFYAIQPTADGITIDGFSFQGNGGRVIDSFTSADSLTIANNIFNNTNIPGGQGGIQLQSGSFDDLTVEQNLFQFTGDGDALVVGGGGSFEGMHIVGNHFAGTTGGIFQNGGTINDAVVEQNVFTGGVGMNMGDAGNIQIRENTFDGNFFTGFQVGTIGGEIIGNTFQNIEAYPGFFGQAFELWGGQYGTTVSENVTIENNVIHYNDVAGAAEPTHGIRLRLPDGGSGIDASTIHINNNAFLDGGVRGDAKAIRHFGDQTTAVDASGNWWGTTSESSIAALMEDGDGGTPLMVDFTPFLDNGTDTDLGTAGFQGDFSVLNVTTLGAQTGAVGRIQEAVDSVTAGGTINILTGTFADNVTVDKAVTLKGAGTANTIVDNPGTIFTVTANDVKFQDMTIQNGSQGIRVDLFATSGTADNLQVDNVHFVDLSSRGIEIHNNTTVTNMSVTNSLFQNTGTGIRVASSAVGDGIDIDQTTFDTNSLAFYQANDGSTGNVRDLQITNSTFRNSTDTAVFGEEIRDSAIDGNLFENNHRDFTLFKNYTGAGTDVENLQIINNIMTDSEQSSILIWSYGSGLAGAIDINGNTITSDVGVMTANWPKIDVRLDSSYTHAPVNINENSITFSGTYGAGATAVYGIKVRGASDTINIERNTLDGGNVGSSGGIPETSGIYVQTDDSTMGTISATAVINVANNSITGFDNAVSVYNAVGATYGNLTAGAQLNINNNSLAGNTAGVVSGAGAVANASNNWWGSVVEATVAGLMSGPVDFTSYLNSGADTDGGTTGFQGDFSSLTVTDEGAQTGPTGRIAEALQAVTPGGTVKISSGTYNENVNTTATGIDKSVTLAPGNSPGQVIINGDLILNADDILDIEVNGATPGSGFDQFVVSGTVDLGGASLNLIDGYDPVDGDVFTLIQNDGAGSVTGTFPGLPEGYEFANFLGSGLSAYITYVGGDGNDVVIHMVDSTPEVDLPTNGTDDEYTIEIDGGNVVITEVGSGNIISSIPLASLNGPLVINGEDNQDDTLTIDMTGIDHTSPLQIEFNGGVGGFDSVELINGSLTSMEYFFVNNSDGSIQLNDSGINFLTYTGLEPISSTINATNVTLNYGGTSETITVTDAGGGQTTVNSTAGEVVTFNNPTGTLTINAGGGDDIVNVNTLDPAFAADIIINGEGNDDTVNLAAALNLGSGNTTINAEDVNVNGVVTTTGNVDINAGDTIVFDPSGELSTSGNIDLEAVNNIELGAVSTTADVILTSSTGAINDANAGSVNITSGGTTTLSAATGVGVGDALETALNFLEGNISGGLELAEVDGIIIGNVGGLNGLTVSGNTTITSGAGFVVNENLAVTGGALQLSNAGGNFDVGFGAIISNDGSNLIQINSAGLIVMTDTGTEITSSGNGTIDLDAAVHILLTNVNTSGEVQVTAATGQIFDNTAAEAPVISADAVALRAAGNIGIAGAGDLNLDVNRLAADAVTDGIFLQNNSGATIDLIDGLAGVTAAGNIAIEVSGGLAALYSIEATGAGSTILVDAQGTMNVDADVQTNGGAIELRAEDSLGLFFFSNVDTTSAAAITLVAGYDLSGNDLFTQGENHIINAHGGTIDVTSTGDARVSNLQSAGGIVTINSTSGSILDFTVAEAPLITAAQAALSALNSIGTAAVDEDIDTAVGTLAAASTNNDLLVSNNSGLVVGDVGLLSGAISTNGAAVVNAVGALNVTRNVLGGGGPVVLSAADTAGAGDDLTIGAGVTVQSTFSTVNLLAGDDLNVDQTAVLSGAVIHIYIDEGNADPGVGGVANLNGTLIGSSSGINVTGDSDADQVIIDGNGGALNNGGTVDGIQGLFTFYGEGGSDELIVDDSGDATGDTINVISTLPGSGTVVGAGSVGLGFEDLEDLTVYSGTDIDDITVNPNVLTTIDIVGGNPTAPTFPGDSLTYLTPPGESSTFTPDGLDGGTISATGGYQDVTFDEIEGLTFGGSIVVDGTAGDDTLTITALTANSGTYQINGGPVINFTANTDFTFNGLNGDDTLIINNPAGGLFDPVNGINFNGGTGGETLGDTLQILGGTAATVEHQFVDNNNGSVFFNGEGTATITYTGLEPIDDTITATNRIFTFTGAAETITLSDDAGPGDGLSLIDSDLGESVNFIHPLATLTINTELSGGSGADTVNIDPLDSTFTANLTVNAGTDDTINTGAVGIGAGALDLAAGQVNVNGAFTTTGSVDIEATAADITFGAAGSIDAGASEIDLTAFFNVESLNVTTTSEVRVTATGGGINDLTGNALITADRAALRVGGPGGITGIDTNVNTLATSVAGGGFTIDNTGALEIGTVDGLAGITAAASSIFLTTTGTLLVSDTVTGGAVDLRSNDTMTISDNVSASTGTLKLENFGGDFVLNSPAQISNAAAFLIDIDSAGAVNLADGSLIASLGTGLIDIDAVNNIALANLNTSGEVQITTSAGAITDNSGSEASLITANTTALRAATGIGSAGAGDIDLAINTMSADTTAGDIYLQEPSAATVGTVDGLAGITAAGNISLVIGGLLNVNDTIEATGAASTILIDGQGDINVNSTVQTNGGSIDLLADNDLTLGVTSVVDTTSAAAVTLVADNDAAGGGGFTQTEGGVVDARGGDLDIETTDDILIADLRSVGGRVLLDSLSGSIVDNTAGETPLITADEAALEAFNNIGVVGAADIDTAVNTLAATTPNGNILISNTGALTIGSVDGLVGVNSVLGFVDVSASSPLTVSSNVTGAGTVTLTATDSAVAGDDLTIDPGVTVESTGADVVLTAGDDFTMDATSQINAATTIGIYVDPSAGDPDAVGGTVDLVGGISAPGGTTVTGGDDDDTFNILPSSTSTIAVVGGDPTLPAVPGDTLNIDLSGVTDPALVLGGAPGSGTFNFLAPDTELPVSYSSIEDVNTLAGAYHLVLDMFFSGFEDASDDTIDVGLDAGGTNLLIDINGSNFFTGNDADILSFTVLGSADNDTLNINETAGGLPMFTTAAPAGIPGSNGAHLNLAAETFLED
ncbi:beta strand repeat-containing protein, partial [Gimesia chilikensis]|uniref:beta strand repeat-containing protein n=1 Tax=Gimesia chilikensis TaxID=2605989 RepID=UPI003A952772